MSEQFRSPLAWATTEPGADLGIHVSRVRALSDAVLILDVGQGADALEPGTLCALMAMCKNELAVIESTLKNGPAAT